MEAAPEVLLAGFEPAGEKNFSAILRECGFTARSAETIPSPEDPILNRFNLVLCSERAFDHLSQFAGARRMPIPVVVASRLDDWDSYLKAMRKGAFDYVGCPPRRHEVEWVVRSILRRSMAVASQAEWP